MEQAEAAGPRPAPPTGSGAQIRRVGGGPSREALTSSRACGGTGPAGVTVWPGLGPGAWPRPVTLFGSPLLAFPPLLPFFVSSHASF